MYEKEKKKKKKRWKEHCKIEEEKEFRAFCILEKKKLEGHKSPKLRILFEC